MSLYAPNSHAPPQADVLASTSDEDGANSQPPPPPASDGEALKKARADWTLPPHLRETLPLNPKGGRAPKPPATTMA